MKFLFSARFLLLSFLLVTCGCSKKAVDPAPKSLPGEVMPVEAPKAPPPLPPPPG